MRRKPVIRHAQHWVDGGGTSRFGSSRPRSVSPLKRLPISGHPRWRLATQGMPDEALESGTYKNGFTIPALYLPFG
jgi:hypothetical protein